MSSASSDPVTCHAADSEGRCRLQGGRHWYRTIYLRPRVRHLPDSALPAVAAARWHCATVSSVDESLAGGVHPFPGHELVRSRQGTSSSLGGAHLLPRTQGHVSSPPLSLQTSRLPRLTRPSTSANMAYACNMIHITDSAPSKRLLGSLNGVAQMCS